MGIIIPNMGINNLSISNVLFSKVQQQLLRLLYGQPDKDFYTNEIIRFTHSGTGAVQRELARLTAVGIITLKSAGNQKRYQANRLSPLFFELRGIILKTFGLADMLKKALDPLTKKIHCAFVYGSIAKQEDTEKSDIDLIVISDNLSYSEVFQYLMPVEEMVGRKINPTFYTPVEWNRKKKEKNNFILQIDAQPKIFIAGDEHELIKLGELSKDWPNKG